MDLESRKYKLIEKLLQVKEESTIYKLESMLDSESENGIWDRLSPDAQKILDASIEQSQKGQVRPHEEVLFEIKKKYNIA